MGRKMSLFFFYRLHIYARTSTCTHISYISLHILNIHNTFTIHINAYHTYILCSSRHKRAHTNTHVGHFCIVFLEQCCWQLLCKESIDKRPAVALLLKVSARKYSPVHLTSRTSFCTRVKERQTRGSWVINDTLHSKFAESRS